MILVVQIWKRSHYRVKYVDGEYKCCFPLFMIASLFQYLIRYSKSEDYKQ